MGYTYKEYKTWDEDIRVELMDGIPYMMASPDEWHQELVLEFGYQLKGLLKGRTCTPYIAPFDVRLFFEEDESDNVIVQPDVFVVCNPEKVFKQKSCNGVPDFIIEVLSEWSEGRDLIDKKKKYEKAGVKEYWVAGKEKLYIYILEGSKYTESVIKITRMLKQPIASLNGIIIDFRDVVDRYT